MKSMLPSFKKCLCLLLLAAGWQTSWAYSLLGPVGAGEDASEQIRAIGYNPLQAPVGPPGFTDGLAVGPRNLPEFYRLNTPVLYYTFDPSFSGYFGSAGENAVQQAFNIMNSLTNVDSYSTNLSEFPLNSEGVNYQAETLGLADVKSTVLSIILEEMGLGDSVRYNWVLLGRDPGTLPCPGSVTYYVSQRNFDITATSLYYNGPDIGSYSPYINGELYSYFISEDCGVGGVTPLADALEIPVDPLNNNPPVASGNGEDALLNGYYYTGLTRDDVAGLRVLLSTNNVFDPGPNFFETSAGGSSAVSGGNNTFQTQITNFPLASLSIDDPNTLLTNFPGIVINSVLTNVLNGVTNYSYSFGNNLIIYSSTSNSLVQILTTNVAPVFGAPVGSPPETNVTVSKSFVTNLVSGDFYIVPTNSCGFDILQTLSTNVVTTTNLLVAGTNAAGNFFSRSLISHYTNHVLLVLQCTNAPGATNAAVTGDLQGIGRVRFVYVPDSEYDASNNVFRVPITNNYTMVLNNNGQLSTVTFQRVVTRPDIRFMGENLSTGGNGLNVFVLNQFSRTIPNFVNSRTAAGLAGPGIIDPTVSQITIILNTVGPVYVNTSPTLLYGPNGGSRQFVWGSFDGSTNPPTIYPTWASLATLGQESLIQITPTSVPSGVEGQFYDVSLSATGGALPYSWSLVTGSILPPGLSLSPSGVISGTPTQSGTYGDIAVQMTDHNNLTVQIIYSITINQSPK